jgi:hypothetical protein
MPAKASKLRSLPRISKTRRSAVTRTDYDRVVDMLNERGEILAAYRAALDEHRAHLEQIDREQDTQLKRIAQLQADVDRLRRERMMHTL